VNGEQKTINVKRKDLSVKRNG